MKFLINDKEYAEVLAKKLIDEHGNKKINYIKPSWKKTVKTAKQIQRLLNPEEYNDLRLAPKTTQDEDLIKSLIQQAAMQDLSSWINQVLSPYRQKIKKLRSHINQRFGRFNDIDLDKIHQIYIHHKSITLTKSISTPWRAVTEFVPRERFDAQDPEPVFIRNIVHNESILKTRIDQNLKFWFMDTGYTNFLETHKKFHRLVINDIHVNSFKKLDDKSRMHLFPSLPQPWRESGNDIVVIEPSDTVCYLYGIDLPRWRLWMREQIAGNLNSDKRVIFRTKQNKKIRANFYRHLQDEDVYCVIHHNSNAAVEAIWAGVPVITLGSHITSHVSGSLENLDCLPTPDLKFWLRWLSFNQFTYDEICNGTARQILEGQYIV